jgi:tetraacyldisaccharide 4'-kinase
MLFATWLQNHWYNARPPLGLIPFSAVFRGIVALRRWAYRHGWKTSEKLPVPVIVVGNLTVGGTGKTPLTIWLVEFLRAAGYKPGVISRGYRGRKQHQPLLVTAASDPDEAGDEPVLIAWRTGCPVYVFPRRVEAGRALLAAHDCDIVIADDGLQHYALARDVEIAVVDGERRFGNGYCLPAGPLREPVSRLREVDLIVCRGQAQAGEYALTLHSDEAVNLADESVRKPLKAFAGEKLLAVAGIGFPQRFFADLKKAGLEIEERAFPDHHHYVPADLQTSNDALVLMTEKDGVKCRSFANPKLWAVPLQAHLPAAFGEQLLQLLKVKSDGQKTA